MRFWRTLPSMKPERPPAVEPGDPSAAWVAVFRGLGLPAYPVEADDGTVRIVAPAEDCARLLEDEIREPLIRHGKALGYRFVTLDLTHLAD